jgi:hypothetical protein
MERIVQLITFSAYLALLHLRFIKIGIEIEPLLYNYC